MRAIAPSQADCMPRWHELLLDLLASAGDAAVGFAPMGLVLLFLWLVDRAAGRLPLSGAVALLFATAAGAALGLGALLLSPVGLHLTPASVLTAGAWWDVPGAELGQRFHMAFAGLRPMLTTPVDALPPLPAACAVVALLMAAAGGAAAVGGVRLAHLPAIPLVGAAVTAWACAAMLVIIAACVLAWTLSLLNFWMLGLALLAWQYLRHGRL